MYAIVEVGAKQFVVKKDDIIEARMHLGQEGKEVSLDKVLLFSDKERIEIGQPYLKTVKVKAKVLKHARDAKTVSFKYRKRKSSHWKKGHRQDITRLKITELAEAA